MVEDIKLDRFPKAAGIYLFKIDNEVIYVGSSNNIYLRMVKHKSCIRKGSAHGYKQDLYEFLQINTFTVEFYLTDIYRQLEQELVEKYHPRYNSHRAYTGLGNRKGRVAEYNKERYQKYKEEILGQMKKYQKSDKGKEAQKKYQKSDKGKEAQKKYYKSDKGKETNKKAVNKYQNQLCSYNGETLTLNALRMRFKKLGITHPTLEAKKYLLH